MECWSNGNSFVALLHHSTTPSLHWLKMHQAEIIVLLFAAVAALVVVARKLDLPYPVVLVLAGLALSFIPHLPEVKLDPNLVFFFFLPPPFFSAPAAGTRGRRS